MLRTALSPALIFLVATVASPAAADTTVFNAACDETRVHDWYDFAASCEVPSLPDPDAIYDYTHLAEGIAREVARVAMAGFEYSPAMLGTTDSRVVYLDPVTVRQLLTFVDQLIPLLQSGDSSLWPYATAAFMSPWYGTVATPERQRVLIADVWLRASMQVYEDLVHSGLPADVMGQAFGLSVLGLVDNPCQPYPTTTGAYGLADLTVGQRTSAVLDGARHPRARGRDVQPVWTTGGGGQHRGPRPALAVPGGRWAAPVLGRPVW